MTTPTKGNAINVRVAYGWTGSDPRKDQRWLGIRAFLKIAAAEAEKTYRTKFKREPPRVDIRRLKASPGAFIQASIFKSILLSDIVVADISHRVRSKRSERPANVLLELGAALANAPATRTFVLEDKPKKGLLDGVADLSGILITSVEATPKTKAETRTQLLSEARDLRRSIVSELVRRMRERESTTA